MRFGEFYEEDSADPDVEKLAALCQFLIGRAQDTDAVKQISTDAFLSLAQNQGISLTRSKLIDLSQQPPLSNFIANVEPDKITFRGAEPEVSSTMSVDQARDTVEKMAKRAAKKGV